MQWVVLFSDKAIVVLVWSCETAWFGISAGGWIDGFLTNFPFHQAWDAMQFLRLPACEPLTSLTPMMWKNI
jgi:hypothetical protein